MTTNSEWLWTMGRENPDKLAEWLKAEHVDGKWQSDMVNCGKPFKEGDAVLDSAVIQQANGLIHEANAERDELKSYVEDATADYAKLVKERDELKAKVHDLQIVVDCVDERNKRYCELVSERDNLARDLQDCNREREKWRDLCGRMQDASNEVGRIADEGMA